MSGILKAACGIDIHVKVGEKSPTVSDESFAVEDIGVEDWSGKQMAGLGLIGVILAAFGVWAAKHFAGGSSGGGGGGSSGEIETAIKRNTVKADTVSTAITQVQSPPKRTTPVASPATVKMVNTTFAGQSTTAIVNAIHSQGQQAHALPGATAVTKSMIYTAVVEAKVVALISKVTSPTESVQGVDGITPMWVAATLLNEETFIAQYNAARGQRELRNVMLQALTMSGRQISDKKRALPELVFALSYLSGTPLKPIGVFNADQVRNRIDSIRDLTKQFRDLVALVDQPEEIATQLTTICKDYVRIYGMVERVIGKVEVTTTGTQVNSYYELSEQIKSAGTYLGLNDSPTTLVEQLKTEYGNLVKELTTLSDKFVATGEGLEPDVQAKIQESGRLLKDVLARMSSEMITLERSIASIKSNLAKVDAVLNKLAAAVVAFDKYYAGKLQCDGVETVVDLVKGAYFCR